MRKPNPWLHAVGFIGIMNLVHAVMMYQTFYYVDGLGMAVAAFALAKTAKSVWDAVNDPLLGYLSDRTRTRFGRRRPWILVSLPFYALSFMALFWVPPAFQQGPALFWYLVVVVFIFETCDTIMQTNYGALFPELFRTVEERTRAMTIKQIFHTIAFILGMALPNVFIQFFGYNGMAVIFTSILLITIPLMLLGSPEDPAASEAKPFDVVRAFRETARDKGFWIFAGIKVSFQIAGTILMTGVAFYVKYALKLDMMGAMAIMGAMYLLMMPLMAVWAKVARTVGVKQAFSIALGLFALATISFFFAQGLVGGVLVGVLLSPGYSGVMVLGDLVLANLIDLDARRTGQRREGIYYSINNFYSKLANAGTAYGFVAVGVLFGYRGAEDPGSNPDLAFRFLMSVIPFAFLALGWVLARFLPATPAVASTAPAPLPVHPEPTTAD
ncbi:MAG: MFS transporter [Bacillota bacterium]